jgi:hypothetical protein
LHSTHHAFRTTGAPVRGERQLFTEPAMSREKRQLAETVGPRHGLLQRTQVVRTVIALAGWRVLST